ncbi:MAG: Fur family transcriptional regulator [Patescibacteria group bacterium]
MKTTRNRDSERLLLLLDCLRNRKDHPDAQACYESMKKLVPDIGRSTVYRHLKTLQDQGLIIQTNFDGGVARFDATTGSHAHFLCTKCNKLMDVYNSKVDAKWPGQTEEVWTVAKGICENCKINCTK